jgi:hypothetical protein
MKLHHIENGIENQLNYEKHQQRKELFSRILNKRNATDIVPEKAAEGSGNGYESKVKCCSNKCVGHCINCIC